MKRVLSLAIGIPTFFLAIACLWLHSKVMGEPGLVD